MSFYADLALPKIGVCGNISTGDVFKKGSFSFVRRRVINKATYNTAIRDFFHSEIEATFKKRYFPIISPQYIRKEYMLLNLLMLLNW